MRIIYLRFETVPGTGNDHLGPEIEHLAEQHAGRRGYESEALARAAGRAALSHAITTWHELREARGARRVGLPTVRFVVFEPDEDEP